MKLIMSITVLTILSAAGMTATIYVPDDHSTIQEAIDASASGDTIIVRPGRYVGEICFLGKAITLESEKGARRTIIDGGGVTHVFPVVLFYNGEGNDSVLDGFTITNGVTDTSWIRGGIYCDHTSPVIKNNIITGNNTTSGGGCRLWGGSPILINNIITGNKGRYGGGLYIWNWSTPQLVNNTITGNTAEEWGGGMVCQASPVITNTIIWGNTAPQEPGIHVSSGTPDITYSDIEGGWAGAGNFDADPLLVDPANEDFHLSWQSPCRDSGDNSPVTEPVDAENDPRIAAGTVDIGADEFYHHLYHVGDAVPGGTIDLKVIGFPSAPVFAAWGYGKLDPPLQTQHGDLHIWPFVWSGHIGNIPSNGVLTMPVTISSSWNPGDHAPMQALIGPWGGPWTTLTNLDVVTLE